MEIRLAYLISRIAIGLSFFGHGLVRLPKLEGFSNWMVNQFSNSLLPKLLVLPFSYFLPIAELVVGFFILLGLFTRKAYLFAGFITLILIFGTTLIENWEALPSQLIHIAFVSILLVFISYNDYGIDKLIHK